MNKDQATALVTGILKVIGAILTAKGATAWAALTTSADVITTVTGLLLTAWSFWYSHKYNAALTDPPAANKTGGSANLLLTGLLAGASLWALAGCTGTQQMATYKTLYTVETTTTAAYDGYLDATLKGLAKTNGLPRVSHAYNTFQHSFVVALDAAQYNTNALAPAALVTESTDVLNLINQLK